MRFIVFVFAVSFCGVLFVTGNNSQDTTTTHATPTAQPSAPTAGQTHDSSNSTAATHTNEVPPTAGDPTHHLADDHHPHDAHDDHHPDDHHDFHEDHHDGHHDDHHEWHPEDHHDQHHSGFYDSGELTDHEDL